MGKILRILRPNPPFSFTKSIIFLNKITETWHHCLKFSPAAQIAYLPKKCPYLPNILQTPPPPHPSIIQGPSTGRLVFTILKWSVGLLGTRYPPTLSYIWKKNGTRPERTPRVAVGQLFHLHASQGPWNNVSLHRLPTQLLRSSEIQYFSGRTPSPERCHPGSWG